MLPNDCLDLVTSWNNRKNHSIPYMSVSYFCVLDAHFRELILSAENYEYIKWLINFKYETLPLRRKIQVVLLKIKAYRALFFELECERLVNE